MNRNIILNSLAVALCLATALLAWHLWRPSPSPEEPAPMPDVAPAQTAPAPEPLPPPPPRTVETTPRFASPDLEAKSTNTVLQLLEGLATLRQLSTEELAAYVKQHNYSAESLLAAFQHTGDSNWLAEAAQRFPDHPQVQLKVLNSQLRPEERLAWIEAFKQSDPDNSLANYLAASQHLKDGNLELALQELQAGNTKKKFSEYLPHSIQNAEELYVQAGNSELEAKVKAFSEIELSHLSELRQFSRNLQNQCDLLLKEGQDALASDLAVTGLIFAQHMSLGDGNHTLINQLVGLSIESAFLSRLDPNQTYADLPMSVDEMRQATQSHTKELKAMAAQFESLMSGADPILIKNYFDRAKTFGEWEALQWLLDQ